MRRLQKVFFYNVICYLILYFVIMGMFDHHCRHHYDQEKSIGRVFPWFMENSNEWYKNENEFYHDAPRQFYLFQELPMSPHLLKQENQTCLKMGTRSILNGHCACWNGWHGNHCSIPSSVFLSRVLTNKEMRHLRLRLRTPRRIIYGAPFNIEFSMLETILHELYDLVDVFVLVESSYTAYGTRKPLRLLPRFHRGYLKKFQDKILYLYFDHFPSGARKDGWIADTYMRSFVSKQGLQHIHGVSDDDLFLVFDIDEIPRRNLLAFLKFHRGYPEPFGVVLKKTTFGFFWGTDLTRIRIGSTVRFLREVYKNDSNRIRSGVVNSRSIRIYRKKGHSVRQWYAGSSHHLAGWHCSSCFNLEGIKTKFMSAQNGDFPRWGSFKEKMNLSYIANLVRDGRWFDDVTTLRKAKNDSLYAPSYILNNAEKYRDLLYNPYI